MNEIIPMSLPATVIAGTNKPKEKLLLIENFLNALHESGINYCHWKSNEHLTASMVGDTDLDMLFDYKEKERLQVILNALGFKKFHSIAQKQYRDIEDFLGLDLLSGKLIHVHAHFRLTLGEAYLKSYQLDLEDKIFETRIFDQEQGIYCIHPAFELILLYFREALKIRNRDVISTYLKNKVACPENAVREFHWLKRRCTEKEIEDLLKTMFADPREIYRIVSGKFDRKQLLKLSRLIKKEFRKQRLYNPISALILRWYREISVKMYRKSYLLWARPVRSRRINPRGGLVVAVIGADGSGKSTVIANLNTTFKTKLDVYKVYLGRGDGKISAPRKILMALKNLLSVGKPVKEDLASGQKKLPKKSSAKLVYKCLEALTVAHEKNKNLNRIIAAKKKGMLVICDRFPQNQVMGYNDGPLLHHLSQSRNPFFKAVSRIEARVYARAENCPPDIVFKLIAEPALVAARKSYETPLHVLEAKIEGIRNLRFGAGCEVFAIDASESKDKVQQTIKKKIWEAYP